LRRTLFYGHARPSLFFSSKFPHIAFHVVTSDHPERLLVYEDAGGMARRPRRLCNFVPVNAVGGVPDVVTVLVGIAFQDPEPAVENGDFMVLPGLPGSFGDVLRPAHTIGGTPDIVEEFSRRLFRCVVRAAAENP